MIPVFLLTYNEQDFFTTTYTDQFVQEHFVPNRMHFYVLDNGNQPKMQQWCKQHDLSEWTLEDLGGIVVYKISNFDQFDSGLDQKNYPIKISLGARRI